MGKIIQTYVSLFDFIEIIGKAFSYEVLKKRFPLDPIGSFVVDDNINKNLEAVIVKAMELGAIIFVGRSDEDVPSSSRGSRFRLSFRLAPIFKLPFRVYKETNLFRLLQYYAQNKLFDL